MYGYIYLTTNLINNKKYIGQHTSSKFDKRYKGSGTILRQAIQKDGWQNFKCEILQECASKEELNYYERFFIAQYNAVEDPNFYNITPGGDGVPKGTPSPRKGKPNDTARVPCSPEKRQKIIERTKGQHRGNVWMYNPATERRICVPKDQIEERTLQGFILGRHDPQLYKSNSEKMKQNPPRGMLGKKHSLETRKKQSDARKGIQYSEETKERIRLGKLGKILISNDETGKSFYIPPEDFPQYEKEGYHRGRKKK